MPSAAGGAQVVAGVLLLQALREAQGSLHHHRQQHRVQLLLRPQHQA
jgi:hypothetical protein